MSLRAQMRDPVKREVVLLMDERPYWYVHELAEQVRGGHDDDPLAVQDLATRFMQDELGDLIRTGVVQRRRVEGPAQVGQGPRFQEALDFL